MVGNINSQQYSQAPWTGGHNPSLPSSATNNEMQASSHQLATQQDGAFTPHNHPRIADTMNPTIHGQIPGQPTPYTPTSPTHLKQSHHHLASRNATTSHDPRGPHRVPPVATSPTVSRATDLGQHSYAQDLQPWPLSSDPGPYNPPPTGPVYYPPPGRQQPTNGQPDAGTAGPQKCRIPDCTLNTYFDGFEQQWTEYCGQGHQLQAVTSGLVATCVMCRERPRRSTEPVCGRTCRDQASNASRVSGIYYGAHASRLEPRARQA